MSSLLSAGVGVPDGSMPPNIVNAPKNRRQVVPRMDPTKIRELRRVWGLLMEVIRSPIIFFSIEMCFIL